MRRTALFLIAAVLVVLAIGAIAGYPAGAQAPDDSQDVIVPLPADGAHPASASALGEKLTAGEPLPGPVAWPTPEPPRNGVAATATPEVACAGPCSPEDFAADVVRLVNEERARAGCAALAVDPILKQVAYAHSKDMGDNDYFHHRNPSGQWPSDRVTAAGYEWQAVAENIAGGQASPAAAMTSWISSTVHHSNMINCNFCETGVGYYYSSSSDYGHYWTQVFARPLDRDCRTPVTPTPTVTPKTPTPTVTPKTPSPTTTPRTPTPIVTVTPGAKRKAYMPMVMKSIPQIVPATIVSNGNFERGPNGAWQEESTNFGNEPGALITDKVAYSGSYGAWLGGRNNEHSSLYQYLRLPNVHGLHLRFIFYVRSDETDCSYDIAQVYWDSVPLKQILLCGGVPYPDWAVADISLEGRGVPAGATGWLSFDVATDESAVSHLFIDDVSIYLPTTE